MHPQFKCEPYAFHQIEGVEHLYILPIHLIRSEN